MSRRSLVTGLACAVTFSVVTSCPALAADTSGPVHATGTLSDGLATWVADVPAEWNGTLVLFSHGFRPGPANPATNSPDPATAGALLAEGYALVGSSYERPGWTLDTAVDDQLETLAVFRARFGEPERVLAVGQSMGGLVTGQLAEREGTGIDGALPTCGLMEGGVDLLNYQLDGAHALAQLLTPDGGAIRLADFLDAPDQVAVTVQTLLAAVDAAQQTPQGRARIALAAGLFHLPRWADGQPEPGPQDHAAQQQAQYVQLKNVIAFTYPARLSVEQTVGGNPSWNIGVDYRALVRHADERSEIEALYRDSGLDLSAELDQLTRSASVAPDGDALARADEISELTGDLEMPVLSIHTTHDILAPVQVEEEYAETVEQAGERGLLRQAFVHRLGHCAFTPAELVASVHALDERVEVGHWTRSAKPGELDRAAEGLGLGEAAFVDRYRPAEWLGDRGGALGGPRY